eukprot:TRINITY_DN26850_c0_g1_i2.p1 TRINITY_DN26850_c0_g1~~TRINITY_DN26850_c0_g1_i2.p1  ORF type:complete len:603 (-),score=163.02 TRINITY_DN26850_c0_g1_i2:329-2137(-)
MARADEFKAKADATIAALAAKQEAWGGMSAAERSALLGELQQSQKDAYAMLPSVSDACCMNVGFDDPDAADATPAWCLEQIVNAAMLTGFVGKLKATVDQFAKDGSCPAPLSVRKAKDGRLVADVHPLDAGDKYGPKKAWKQEVWMQQGKEATQGKAFSEKPRTESCGLVLGAGNLGALTIIDTLHVMFQCNTVVLIKLHPLRTYQETFLNALFRPLISKGYLAIMIEENGIADAAHLVNHPSMCHVHMTGATATHDAIVWGPPAEQAERKKKNTPVLSPEVKMTSELGCVTPYMVCPAKFSAEELAHHAKHLAVTITANNSYFCNSPKVLLLAEEWDQKEEFLQIMKGVFAAMPNPPPYYPGSHKRYDALLKSYPAEQVEKIEGPNCSQPSKFGARIPWTFIKTSADAKNLDASKAEAAFANEPFCPILTICTLKGTSGAKEYLEAVTKLSNEYIWGTLSCTLLVHPTVEEAESEAVEAAVADLKYGAVVLNTWSGEAYSMFNGLWGGYAGPDSVEKLESIQSGIGFVGNTLMFDHPSKVVVRSPFMDPMHMGVGEKLTKRATVRLTDFLVFPGFMTFLKMLAPSVFDGGCWTICAKRHRD